MAGGDGLVLLGSNAGHQCSWPSVGGPNLLLTRTTAHLQLSDTTLLPTAPAPWHHILIKCQMGPDGKGLRLKLLTSETFAAIWYECMDSDFFPRSWALSQL
jgi:hypothetical protein